MKTVKKAKKVIILGGSSGIGKATAERFAAEGWEVLIGSHDLENSKKVSSNLIGTGHKAYKLDVRSEKDIKSFRDKVKKDFGTYQVLVNSVGVSEGHHSIESDFTKWDNAIQVMLYGSVKICRALVPLMEDGGRVINITSIHHDRVAQGSSAYGMAKAAITQFTRSLALELAPRNILANAIAPGFVNTPMSIKKNGKNELNSKWFKDNYIKYGHLPLKRAGEPKEIAGTVYFLAGPDATYITGSIITIDGGLTITF